MNTRKLFTDPTEEHADCSKAKCDNSKTSDNTPILANAIRSFR
ncbi:MAG: hypothetical protein R3A13_12675 [Bdellovibrionota bacterium]